MTLTKLKIEKFIRTLKALLILLEAQSHFAFPAGPCVKERSKQMTSAFGFLKILLLKTQSI